MKLNLIIILILLIFLYYYYTQTHHYPVTQVKSDIDDNFYLVRDLPDKQDAANMLAKIKKNIFDLTNHLVTNKKNFPDYIPYIDQLQERIKNVIIQESADNGLYTSYSINKGEQIVFCIRSRDNLNKLHDLNLVMYVAIHELGHVGCPEFGHTELFKKIFAFYATEAVKIKIYTKIDFENKNKEYCGLTITDSII